MKNKNKIIVLVLIAVLVIGCVTVLALSGRKNSKAADTSDTQVQEQEENYISYNGKKYRHKDNIRTYLYMGIDKDGPATQAEDAVSGGQSDAMFLIIVDSKEKNISLYSTKCRI